MKTILNIIVVLAIANLLAIGGFVGWLRSSDRINWERAGEVRKLLSKTITDEKSEALAASAKMEADKKAAVEAVKAARPPLTAEERLAARIEATKLDEERINRLHREVEDLQRGLAAERTALDGDKAAFAAQRKAFEDSVKSTQLAQTDAQFQKSLTVLTTMKPAQAATILQQLITTGQANFAPVSSGAGGGNGPLIANGTPPAAASPVPPTAQAGLTDALRYLDAMDDRPRGKIITEITKTDPKLATQLLEQLRKRGEVAGLTPSAP
ncbi:MAG: hypothetical protein WC718_00580 [Phycisphaerales bacterium]